MKDNNPNLALEERVEDEEVFAFEPGEIPKKSYSSPIIQLNFSYSPFPSSSLNESNYSAFEAGYNGGYI